MNTEQKIEAVKKLAAQIAEILDTIEPNEVDAETNRKINNLLPAARQFNIKDKRETFGF